MKGGKINKTAGEGGAVSAVCSEHGAVRSADPRRERCPRPPLFSAPSCRSLGSPPAALAGGRDLLVLHGLLIAHACEVGREDHFVVCFLNIKNIVMWVFIVECPRFQRVDSQMRCLTVIMGRRLVVEGDSCIAFSVILI